MVNIHNEYHQVDTNSVLFDVRSHLILHVIYITTCNIFIVALNHILYIYIYIYMCTIRFPIHCSEDGSLGQRTRNLKQFIPDSNIHGANVGPTWGRQDPGGPHVGHRNIATWDVFFAMQYKQGGNNALSHNLKTMRKYDISNLCSFKGPTIIVPQFAREGDTLCYY